MSGARGGAEPRVRVPRTPLFLFATILILAMAQITWWVILLMRDLDPAAAPRPEDRGRRIVMVASEGVAFAVAMTFGAWLIYRSVRREEQLRRDEANFLAAVTHELKSPLASLRLHAETLELRSADAERVRTYSKRMVEDVDRLQRLVENLLAAARAEAGLLDVRPTDLDLSAELSQYVESTAPLLIERGLELRSQIAEGVRAMADPAAFRSVVENLVDNAVKYSSAPAAIDVRLRREANRAVLEVSDSGVGLAPEEAARVFERFYRAGDERVRTTKGTGLGLYLVREIARAHRGDVAVESPGRGRGATFRVWWPMAPVAIGGAA
ncbi:MAG: HAMP domain-containing histidine kinase [Planctomycetes bacterium]|nr:HAMP domain-containing histidine kinase [Planctomycetota bacterium]